MKEIGFKDFIPLLLLFTNNNPLRQGSQKIFNSYSLVDLSLATWCRDQDKFTNSFSVSSKELKYSPSENVLSNLAKEEEKIWSKSFENVKRFPWEVHSNFDRCSNVRMFHVWGLNTRWNERSHRSTLDKDTAIKLVKAVGDIQICFRNDNICLTTLSCKPLLALCPNTYALEQPQWLCGVMYVPCLKASQQLF